MKSGNLLSTSCQKWSKSDREYQVQRGLDGRSLGDKGEAASEFPLVQCGLNLINIIRFKEDAMAKDYWVIKVKSLTYFLHTSNVIQV
jgi:hypothetical protein